MASTALAVDAAMEGWAVWVVKGQATQEQEDKVRAAYEKYQISMEIASNAYTNSIVTGNRSAWQVAQSILVTNGKNIGALVFQFQTKLP